LSIDRQYPLSDVILSEAKDLLFGGLKAKQILRTRKSGATLG
jgi:hypothetical protein